jgi:hypothetical protein
VSEMCILYLWYDETNQIKLMGDRLCTLKGAVSRDLISTFCVCTDLMVFKIFQKLFLLPYQYTINFLFASLKLLTNCENAY